MKQENMIALGLAAVAVYLLTQTKKTTIAKSGGLTGTNKAVSEIFDASGGAFSNGWRYFSDGTAIDPSGNYFYGGQKVWDNPFKSVALPAVPTLNTLFDV